MSSPRCHHNNQQQHHHHHHQNQCRHGDVECGGGGGRGGGGDHACDHQKHKEVLERLKTDDQVEMKHQHQHCHQTEDKTEQSGGKLENQKKNCFLYICKGTKLVAAVEIKSAFMSSCQFFNCSRMRSTYCKHVCLFIQMFQLTVFALFF